MAFQIEIIPNKDFVLRRVLPFERTGPKKRRFPNESHFELRPNEKGLSVNWEKYLSLSQNYIIIGLTYKMGTKKFQDHTAFKIFKFPVSFLRSIVEIQDVIHSPIYNGNPAPVGNPNNIAHSEVLYENDVEIYVKLSSYCDENFNEACCNFEVNSVNEKIEELRLLLNDTPYHKTQQ